MTQAAFDIAVEAVFKDLLIKYNEAIDANKAFYELFGATPGAVSEYEEYQAAIAAATTSVAKGSDVPITTAAMAEEAIIGTKFKDARIRYKKIGITTLIDPQILPENQTRTPFWSGIWNSNFARNIFGIGGEAQTDLFFNPGAGFMDTGLVTTYSSDVLRGLPVTAEYPHAGFVAEPIIVYLINRGKIEAKGGASSTPNNYFSLAQALLNIVVSASNATADTLLPNTLLDPFIVHSKREVSSSQEILSTALTVTNAPPVTELWKEPLNLDSVVSVFRDALRAFGSLTGPAGALLTAAASTAPVPAHSDDIYYSVADPSALKTEAQKVSVRTIVQSVNTGEIDDFIEAISLDLLGSNFYSEENRRPRIEVQKKVFIDFLLGNKQDLGDSDIGPGDLQTALKDEKVREAVLKADRNIKPFDFQCHLMQNIVKLAHQRQLNSRFQPRYRHINPVTTGGRPAEVLNTIQHGNQTPEIKEFINICPDVYGLLEPYIQIWRQEFNDDGTIKMKDNKPVEKQLHIENFLNPADLITLPTGRTPGAGIKSFSWSLKGVQPAEVDNNISANLVMYFQTIDDFFNGASQAGKDEPNFLDLIINSPAVRKLREGKTAAGDNNTKLKKCNFVQDNLHQQYKGTNYRIRVNAGWSVPPSLMPDIEISAPLRRAIEQTQVSLYLQQVRHNLDFKQNGSLELSIEYVASIAGLLTSKSADIFAPSSSPHIDARIAALDEDLQAIKIKETNETFNEGDKKRKKELLELKRQSRQEDKLIKYRKLLCGLFQEQNSRIYNLTVNALDLLRPPMRDLDERQRAARAKRFKSEPVAVYLANEVNFSLLGSIDATLTGNGLTQEEGESPPGTAQTARDFSETESARFENIKKDPGSFRFIPFFYLGDLIDSVLQQIANNNGAQQLNFKMFLSETEMIDPNMALQIGDLENVIKCGEGNDLDWLVRLVESDPQSFPGIAGLSTIMNIGDIPISLDAFQVWFKDHVIKKNRESYFFLHFIKDICADLITKAMGSQCFGSNINFSQRFDAQPLHLAKASSIKTGRVVSSSTLGNLHKKVLPTLDTNKSIGGFILVSTDSKPSELKGDFHSDLERGIYHHFIGASCGLLKNMAFNREDQEYLREAKIQKYGALGAEQLRELYSARLELVGNNLYKNGMYIYINPTLIGASQDELDFLGLHGYYLVTGVESKVTPSGFTTSITALHEGIRFDKSRLPSISVQQGIIAEAQPVSIALNPKKEPEAKVTIPLTDIVVSESVAGLSGINIIPFGAGK
jgi:hypothetical protein